VNSVAIAAVTFACAFGGALLGLLLRPLLAARHVADDSKDVVKIGMGVVSTMLALVLGLLVASAKNSFDTLDNEVKQSAANVLLLDRTLAHYGPETKEIRDLIRSTLAYRLARTWPEDRSATTPVDLPETTPTVERVEEAIRTLSPHDDGQRWLQSRALQLTVDIEQARWLVFGGAGTSLSVPFFVVVTFWMTIIFVSFGLFAPPNAMVISALLMAAMSMAASMYLIVELSHPFEGLMKISSAPLRYTLAHLSQ
jgi:hypothetical protein